VPDATVCIGSAGALDIHHRGTTDAQGSVRFATFPADAFVATASTAGRGAQRSVAPASPNLALLRIDLALPAAGGPSCPSAAQSATRTLSQQVRAQAPAVTPTPRPPSITIAQSEFCFGAIGAECGQPQSEIPGAALCRAGSCFINGGSWEHDECCFDHPRGLTCDFDPLHQAEAARDQACLTAWNKAVRLTRKGLSWTRSVDFSRANRSGNVEFALFCAPANALVPPQDANKCCTGQTRALDAAQAAAALAVGETLRACR
jgi:hypothetical protein